MKRPDANLVANHADGRPFVNARAIGLGCAILGVALLLAAPGCASKKKAPVDSEMTSRDVPASNIEHYIDADKQERWVYSAMPTPEPSSKPNYLLKSFTFEKNSASLNAEARGVLGSLAEDLAAKPDITVLIVGMCDSNAEAVNAQNLGMNRAQNARKVLIDRGVARNRVEIASFGSSQATAPASETVGQAFDRRVEVWLLTE